MQTVIDRALGIGVPIVDRVFAFWPVRGIAIVFDRFGRVGGGIFAWGLANRALFALLPGLLLVVSFVGLLARDPDVQQRIFEGIAELAPPLQGLITDSVALLAEGAVAFGLIGLVTLVWGASGFLQALEVAYAVLLGEERRRDPVARGLIGILGVMAILGVLLVAIVVSAVAWPLLDRLIGPEVDLEALRLLSPVIETTLVALALGATYLAIPTRRPPLRAAWLPAVGGAVAITVLTQVVALISPLMVGLAALYGAIASVFLLLVWLQLSIQVVLLGMVWTGLRAFGWPSPDELAWPMGTLRRPVPGGAPSGPTDG